MTQKRLRGPEPGCRKCGCELLLGENWSVNLRKNRRYWCNPCYAERQRIYSLKDGSHNEKKASRAKLLRGSRSLEARERERRVNRNAVLRRKYGITIDQYEAMLARQTGKCAVCFDVLFIGTNFGGKGNKQVHLDHCHATGVVRGILCGHCNRMIGMARERAWVLHRAADYICLIRSDPPIVHSAPINGRSGRPLMYRRPAPDQNLEARAAGGKKY